jgi:hypothetical protein
MKDLQKPRQTKGSKSRSGFRVEWVKLPRRWIDRLQAANVGPATYQLAHTILVENFKLDQMVIKEIVLSEKVTGLSRPARRKAIGSLVELKLIKVRRGSGRAVRVVDLYY